MFLRIQIFEHAGLPGKQCVVIPYTLTKKEAFQVPIGNEAPLFFVCNGTRSKFSIESGDNK